MTSLEVWDYVTLFAVVLVTGLVGLYHIWTTRKTKMTKDFLVNSRQLGIVPLTISNLATFVSAVAMMGLPMETYTNGLTFGLVLVANFIIIPFAVHLFIPVFYELNRNTIFEYLELRFSSSIRIITSIVLSVQMLLYAAVAMYAPALAINQVTGLHLWASVAAVGVICIIYTAFGGFKAVVWADVSQFIVMTSVMLLILIKGIVDIGGLKVVWERLQNGNRATIVIWDWSPYSQYSLWTMTIGNVFYRIAMAILNQSLMQRYLSNKTLKQAQISSAIVSFGITLIELCLILIGILIYAKYYQCDPLLSGQITKGDQLMALFAVQTLSFCKGLPGVFVAGILCGTISTLSSLLNSLTAVTISDYIKPLKPQLSEKATMKLSKLLVLIYGIISIVLVAFIGNFGGIIKAVFAIFGITYGPILTIFTIGMLFPCINFKAAIVGFAASLLLPWWACVGNLVTSPTLPQAPLTTEGCYNSNITLTNNSTIDQLSVMSNLESFYSLSSLWYAVWSLVTGLVTSFIASIFIGFQDPANVNANLVFPFLRSMMSLKKQAPDNILSKPDEFKTSVINNDIMNTHAAKSNSAMQTKL
ncbi:hypothetical protein CHUAL_009738 [Chamberlinius hualienensis]